MSKPLSESFSRACGLLGPLVVTIRNRNTGVSNNQSLSQSYLRLGRHPSNDIRLDDTEISRFHAYFQVVSGRLFCLDLGSRTGILFDDEEQQYGWVDPGRTIRVGPFDLGFADFERDPKLPVPSEPPLAAVPDDQNLLTPVILEQYSSAGATAPVTLDRYVNVIGRASVCALRLPDESVATYHALLANTPKGVWLVDFQSRAGTLVNGKKIRMGRLKDGDLIQIGNFSFLTRLSAELPNPESMAMVPAQMSLHPTKIDHGSQQNATASPMMNPMHEMMDQFQKCMVTMVCMFTSMQQDQLAMFREQVAQIQDVAQDLRQIKEGLSSVRPQIGSGPHPGAATDPTAPRPLPELTHNGQAEGLTEAHAWLLEKLANRQAVPPPKTPKGLGEAT